MYSAQGDRHRTYVCAERKTNSKSQLDLRTTIAIQCSFTYARSLAVLNYMQCIPFDTHNNNNSYSNININNKTLIALVQMKSFLSACTFSFCERSQSVCRCCPRCRIRVAVFCNHKSIFSAHFARSKSDLARNWINERKNDNNNNINGISIGISISNTNKNLGQMK